MEEWMAYVSWVLDTLVAFRYHGWQYGCLEPAQISGQKLGISYLYERHRWEEPIWECAPEQKDSLEAARESLIAISYSVPDTFPAATLNSVDELEGNTGNRADEFRNSLISISYLQSPDIGIIRCNGHV
ncbi:hypothetical protein ACH5RR_040442 [Cinchona calisaya]|uniref:Uncharacterized protein n=1 Tax=Cinchona calisaya TaxID=153742 RepID=A0ABD2XW01_9GENT